MSKDDDIYEAYKLTKRFIERVECCDKDHSHEPLFKELHDAIKTFDSLGRGYAERYEKEKQDASV